MKMDAGICTLTALAVRKKPSHKSEMINQLLFGDLVQIMDSFETWLLIESEGDNYQGWIDKSQIEWVSKDFLQTIISEKPSFLKNTCTAIRYNENKIVLSQGSRLPKLKGHNFIINNKPGEIPDTCEVIKGKHSSDSLIATAQQFLGAPYLWGGRSVFGIDCSGFTQIVYKMNGYQLPRDSSQQAMIGKNIDFIHEARPGDLVFFENEEQQIVHVGILFNNNQIIHASGQVRIDNIDHEGIFNKEKQQYTHKLRLIKRML